MALTQSGNSDCDWQRLNRSESGRNNRDGVLAQGRMPGSEAGFQAARCSDRMLRTPGGGVSSFLAVTVTGPAIMADVNRNGAPAGPLQSRQAISRPGWGHVDRQGDDFRVITAWSGRHWQLAKSARAPAQPTSRHRPSDSDKPRAARHGHPQAST